MRRKIFALFVVPIIIVLGGTMAFSAWSGASTAYFNESAAVVGFNEKLSFEGTNANLTPLIVGNGIFNTTVNFDSLPFWLYSSNGSATGDANVFANVSNMVPGDWVEFNVVITNTGTATLYVGNPAYSFNNATSNLTLNTVVNPNSVINNGPESDTPYATLLGLISPGQSVEYTVFLTLPSDIPASYAGSTQLVTVSVPISVVQ